MSHTTIAYLATFEIRKKGHWCLIQTAGFYLYIYLFCIYVFFKYYFSPEDQEIGSSRFLGVFKLGNRDSPRKNWTVGRYGIAEPKKCDALGVHEAITKTCKERHLDLAGSLVSAAADGASVNF